MKVSDIWTFFKAKSADQAIVRALLKELLLSKPIYTEQKITPTAKHEIQDDINNSIDRMPESIKAKYNEDADEAILRLYDLAINVKNAMKKDRGTPAPGGSQTPRTSGRSSESAVTPGSSQATQPQMLTQFSDQHVIIKFGPGQSQAQPFALSQFTKEGTLRSAPYIDRADLDWSIFSTVIRTSCGWTPESDRISCNITVDGSEYEVAVSDEATWIGALANMVPGLITFSIKPIVGNALQISFTRHWPPSPPGDLRPRPPGDSTPPPPDDSTPPPPDDSTPPPRGTGIHETPNPEQNNRKRQRDAEKTSHDDGPESKRARHKTVTPRRSASPPRPDDNPVGSIERPQNVIHIDDTGSRGRPIEVADDDAGELAGPLEAESVDELQQFQISFTVDRLDQKTWADCQRFYKLKGRFGEQPEETIKIPGLRRSLKPHQAFAVYWMLTIENALNGGYLADDMGLGKTTTAIALCVVSRWVRVATQAVEESRAANDGKHLLPDNQGPDDECPSAADFPICCPCVQAGPTAKNIALRDGLNLVVVPRRLLPVWAKEWKDTVEPHRLLNMTLLLGHGTPIEGIQMVRAFPHRNLLMIAEARDWLHACACMESLNQSLHTEEMRAVAAAAARDKGTIPKDADQFVILSTPKSFSGHVLNPLSLVRRAPVPATGTGSRSEGKGVSVEGARFARAFRDECHDEKGKGSTFALFENLSRRAMPAIWMLSGTPFETSPSDIAFYMSLLEKSRRVQHQALDFCTVKHIQRLGRQFSKQANKADAELGPLIQEFKLILSTLGFIRRTVDSRWFGHTIIELPPNNKMDVRCPIPESYLAAIRPMDSALSTELDKIGAARAEGQEKRFRLSAAGMRKLGQLRILTSFPGLLDLADRLGGLDKLAFSGDELKKLGWNDNPTECPININLDEVLHGSSKFEYLCGMINEGLTDYKGRPEKFLIMTKHPVIVFILTLALANRFPDQHVKALWSSDKDRQSYVDAFQNLDTGAQVEDDTGKIRSPGILVSTTGVIGTGYTCTRAFRAVLFEPDFLEGVEEQAFARIRRMGQCNPRTTCIRFVVPDMEYEKRIFTRQGNRRQLKGASEQGGKHNARNLTMDELFIEFQSLNGRIDA